MGFKEWKDIANRATSQAIGGFFNVQYGERVVTPPPQSILTSTAANDRESAMHYGRGRTHQEFGRIAEAIECYDIAARLDINHYLTEDISKARAEIIKHLLEFVREAALPSLVNDEGKVEPISETLETCRLKILMQAQNLIDPQNSSTQEDIKKIFSMLQDWKQKWEEFSVEIKQMKEGKADKDSLDKLINSFQNSKAMVESIKEHILKQAKTTQEEKNALELRIDNLVKKINSLPVQKDVDALTRAMLKLMDDTQSTQDILMELEQKVSEALTHSQIASTMESTTTTQIQPTSSTTLMQDANPDSKAVATLSGEVTTCSVLE